MVQEAVEQTSDMCVRTRCRSIDELVTMFARYVDGTSIFIATLGMREQGVDTPFTIALADGTLALRGHGTVKKTWTTAENPFRLPGLLLGVRTLTVKSKVVFDRMRDEGSQKTPLPARTRAATIPPIPRMLTPLRLVAPLKPQRGRTTQITGPQPCVPEATSPTAPTSDGVIAEPMDNTIVTERYRAASAPAPSPPRIIVAVPAKPALRTTWWRTSLLIAIALVGLGAGASRALTDHVALAEHPVPAPSVPARATIEIDGTTYAIDIVVTPMANR